MGATIQADDDFTFGRRTAFNTSFASARAEGIVKMNLVYGRITADDHFPAAAGSGYSTLFAKHMACGYLPFAFDLTNNAVDTLEVTEASLESIVKQGLGWCDNGTAHGPKTDARYHLRKLTRASGFNFFAWPHALGAQYPVPGTIWHSSTAKSPHEVRQLFEKVGTWSSAVTRIPFGE